MAVYTPVTDEQMREFQMSYDVGNLVGLRGIEAGVSNTNYHVKTTTGDFILTLYEPHRVRPEDVAFFIDYAGWLERGGVPSPHTQPLKNGDRIGHLNARPATLVSFLAGEGQTAAGVNADKCRRAGETLAKMHLAVQRMKTICPNQFSMPRWRGWVEQIGETMNSISPGLFALTMTELSHIAAHWPQGLAQGTIHADYFPDNVFFSGDDVSGVIDFHFACTDFYAYDLAIALNAWAFDANNNFVLDRYDALLEGYGSLRPLDELEAGALPLLLRAAALRFLLSRIEEKLKWREGDFMVPHDPMVFAHRLSHFQSQDLNAAR